MNFLKETIVVAVIAFLVVPQGVDGDIKCNHCSNWETDANCNGTIGCDKATMCIVAKGVDADGQEKYKKGCHSLQNCDNVKELCGRTTSGITCLAGACCNSSLCTPGQLKLIPMPTSSVKPSPSEAKTSSVEQMAMKSSDVSASPAMQSSAVQTTAAVAAAATTTTKMTMMASSKVVRASSKEVMASSKEVARATETSMKGIMGSPTVKNSEALVPHSQSPTDYKRPTCKDSSGMRHVLSPLAIVFFAARLVNLLL